MSKFTKIAAGTLAALTITVGALATSSTEAQAWGKKGWYGPAIGFGIAAAVIGSAAYAASGPHYYYGAPGCRFVARYDAWGNYRGAVRVCDVY
jgi:hypothetical protein